MGKTLKISLLISTVLISETYAADVLDSSFGVEGRSDRMGELVRQAGDSVCETDDVVDALSKVVKRGEEISRLRGAFENRRLDDLDALKEVLDSVRRGRRVLARLHFPGELISGAEPVQPSYSRLEEINAELEALKFKLEHAPDLSDEARAEFEGKILRLNQEHKELDEQIVRFKSAHTVRWLLDVFRLCDKTLDVLVDRLPTVVGEWEVLMGEYNGQIRINGPIYEEKIAAIESRLKENDTVYSNVNEEIYDTLNLIDFIEGWVELIKQYVRPEQFNRDVFLDQDGSVIEGSEVFNEKETLAEVLKTLHFMFAELPDAPKKFDMQAVSVGITLIGFVEQIQTLKAKERLLKQGLEEVKTNLSETKEKYISVNLQSIGAILCHEIPDREATIASLDKESDELEGELEYLEAACETRAAEYKKLERELKESFNKFLELQRSVKGENKAASSAVAEAAYSSEAVPGSTSGN
ncbi:MAG: hypothetical protein H6492_00210 [Candidatus Paracaedibacteraceae bacterium]|nr:hypothetical protein [Candidatus Paracaedibacteraceae bacterium]